MIPAGISCDLFCRVVDNFGDIGVAWRLARQLQNEHDVAVRLIVDDLDSFQRLAPAVNTAKQHQVIDNIAIAKWEDDMVSCLTPAALVIEAFGCELPACYIEKMATGPAPPVWLNLEYLSAEKWVGEHHLVPSPQPRHQLTKYFFFPGFERNTGGLIRENFLAWPRKLPAEFPSKSMRIFIFAYETAPAIALMHAAIQAGTPAEFHVPEGKLAAKLQHWRASQPENAPKGAPVLDFVVQGFVPQQEFDDLLTSHDLLFVRGEDSLVRAIWSGRPFVWQIYPQDDDAHRRKLDAFLALYCAGLAADARIALHALWYAWNEPSTATFDQVWTTYLAQFPAIRQHALQWSQALAAQPDLAANLLSFYKKSTKI